jgi:hypothetical protein
MSLDQVTQVSQVGLLSRLGKSITGILFGIILTVAAFPVLWWNEGRSVKTYKGLLEGEKVTIDIDARSVSAENDGKLVHLVGMAEAKDEVRDDIFGMASPGMIKLMRHVELYQWVEDKKTTSKKNIGGGEEQKTEYTYKKDWDSKVHNSDHFHEKTGHTNPPPAYRSETFFSKQAVLGAFRLPESLITGWNDYKPHEIGGTESLPEDVRKNAQLRDGWLYLSQNPDQPELGDARVKFQAIPAGETSLLARQTKDTFEPYITQQNTKISRIAAGAHTKEAMFAAAKSENTMITWLIRGGGFLMMFIGLSMTVAPIRVLADILPIAGRIVGAGLGFICFLISAIGSVITIAIAWVWYRPLLGIALLAVVLGLLVMLIKAMRKKTA